MAASHYWTNSDGLLVHFNARDAEHKPRRNPSKSDSQELVYKISWDEVPVTTPDPGLLQGSANIPAGAYIESATLTVTEAFVGATAALVIGTYDPVDNSAVDADGLCTAVAGDVLLIDAIGDTLTLAGAQVDTVLAEDVVIGAHAATAVFTAGEATLVVRYFIAST
jgi:hypothetical protein